MVDAYRCGLKSLTKSTVCHLCGKVIPEGQVHWFTTYRHKTAGEAHFFNVRIHTNCMPKNHKATLWIENQPQDHPLEVNISSLNIREA